MFRSARPGVELLQFMWNVCCVACRKHISVNIRLLILVLISHRKHIVAMLVTIESIVMREWHCTLFFIHHFPSSWKRTTIPKSRGLPEYTRRPRSCCIIWRNLKPTIAFAPSIAPVKNSLNSQRRSTPTERRNSFSKISPKNMQRMFIGEFKRNRSTSFYCPPHECEYIFFLWTREYCACFETICMYYECV